MDLMSTQQIDRGSRLDLPCHVPSASLPSVIGTEMEDPIRDALVCETESL